MAFIKALIVDDEYQGRTFMQRILEKDHPEIEVAGQASTIEETISSIQHHHPNLIFMDVILGRENAFELFEKLQNIDFEIIFTTAHNEYAVKAFKINALDYLLKPIDLQELSDAIEKVKMRLDHQATRTSMVQLENLATILKSANKHIDKLAIPSSDGFIMVHLSEIIYCESDGNYTIFNLTNNRKLTSSYTLRQYDDMLSTQGFFRAHKSFLINLSHINRYLKSEGGLIMMSNGKTVELSRRNKEKLMKLLRW
jgi:two-component system, LytTR family, response regulator